MKGMRAVTGASGATPSWLDGAVALAVAALLAVTVTHPAAAEDFEVGVQGRQLVMQLGGHLVSVPGPLWTAPGEPVEVEESQIVYRRLGRDAESVLLLPVEETLVTWTRMMGILAVGRPGYTGAYHVASMVEPMTQDCTPDQTLIARLPAVRAGGLEGLLLMCGRYRPTRTGPRNCSGGVVVAVVLESRQGAAKVYNEWCTGAFDVRDRASWPVSGEELQARSGELMEGTAFVPISGRASPWLTLPPRIPN